MAKNWTVGEVIEVLTTGDVETIKSMVADCGKRFPNAVTTITAIAANLDSAFAIASLERFGKALPENLTMRKLDSILKDGATEVEEEAEAETEAEEKPVKRRGRKPAAEVEEEDEEEEEIEEEDEEEEEAPKPKKRRGRPAAEKKPAKKPAKKVVEEEEDDEDDWDL